MRGVWQSLGIWSAMSLVIVLVPHVAIPWAAVISGVLSCVLLGHWHRRRGRADTAVGAYTGSVLWPVIIGLAVILIGIVSESRSVYG